MGWSWFASQHQRLMPTPKMNANSLVKESNELVQTVEEQKGSVVMLKDELEHEPTLPASSLPAPTRLNHPIFIIILFFGSLSRILIHTMILWFSSFLLCNSEGFSSSAS
ncbi:hypothetical protein L6164_000800 [Bauhinia variegata]|uniref:Uncharacterized protein n=1 Tax=Bauhinia variegata TaxID=167791 RepID=A0ACB9Q7K9_BAUVA|nr:hypothetical protein L6164_000800 [Bauhinia variegata]